MSTTFPIDVTVERLIEFLSGPGLGTLRTIARDEIGRDVYLTPSPTTDDAIGAIMLLQALEGKTGDEIRASLHAQPEAVAFRSRPSVSTPPGESATGRVVSLHAEGLNLCNDRGERVVLKGYDMFTALRMLLDGKNLQSFLDESRSLGFNCWRVFGQGASTENHSFDLKPTESGYYDALARLVKLLNDNGIYLLFTCYADNQVIKSGLEQWTRSADVLRGTGTFLSGGNEWSKNGFDPKSLPDPGLTFWSRGSDVGDAAPVKPYGTFVEFHPRRDFPKALDDTVASQTFIQFDQRCDRPLIIDEPPRMGEDGSGPEYADPAICWQFARHYATGCAGAVFHARPGQTGFLLAERPLTLRCAQAWQAGMRIP
ncbi:MAG TPA: hypothetical protein VKE96_18880 [Vicinamibacterales bacterium]|nr:hypothetical protein [Vicinamibacterales bacterium]